MLNVKWAKDKVTHMHAHIPTNPYVYVYIKIYRIVVHNHILPKIYPFGNTPLLQMSKTNPSQTYGREAKPI